MESSGGGVGRNAGSKEKAGIGGRGGGVPVIWRRKRRIPFIESPSVCRGLEGLSSVYKKIDL